MRFEGIKRKIKSILTELKREKIGIIGFAIIISLLVIGFLTPWIAPEANAHWGDPYEWRDHPQGAAPSWVRYLSREPGAEHLELEEYRSYSTGAYSDITFEYDYSYEEPPSEIVTYIEGEYEEDRPMIIIELIRPDGESIELEVETIEGSDEGGGYKFNDRFTLLRDREQVEEIYRFAESFEEGEIGGESTSAAVRAVFSEASDSILSDPDPLHGEYKIRLRLISEDVNVSNSRAIFKGRYYGFMGTDTRGRDVAGGWAWGARYGIILGVTVATLTVVISLVYGMTSAYHGGWVDELMQRINETIMGIPTFPLLVVIAYMWTRSYYVIILVLGLLFWRGIAKNIRARGLQIRQNTYVEASESLGASGRRIITKHMVPQMLPYALAEGALMVPGAIIAAAGLNVLGLGDPTIVTWGRMLSEAHSAGAALSGMWWWVILPGLGITLVGFAFISAGMAVERIINPKMKQG